MNQFVSINGAVVDYAAAHVPVEDRGYQFGDGVYEVIRVYNGRPFTLTEHLARLERSAEAIRIPVDVEKIKRDALDLLDRQELREASMYLQVTRGAAVRNHAFPASAEPITTMYVRPASKPSETMREHGIRCITLYDDRWARCYIKSLNLLSNVLAKQQAVEAGCTEALYIRDGFLTEGASSNAYAVLGGVLWTAPKSNYILAGITRDVLLDLARHDGIPVREEPVAAASLRQADEVLISSTTSELLPAVELDARPVGAGTPGPVYRRLLTLFEARIAEECGG